MNTPDFGERDGDRQDPVRPPSAPRSTPSAPRHFGASDEGSGPPAPCPEKPLPDRSERLAHVFKIIGEGLVVQDAHGTIYECNAAAETILGLTRDQMMGLTSMDPLWRAVYPDGSPFPGELHPGMVALRTGRSVRGVEMGIDATGRGRRWISINAEPLRNSADSVVLVAATFIDITARKAAEAALLTSELRFRTYAEQATDAIFVHDFSGRFTYVNSQACVSVGYTEAELLAMSVTDLETQFDLPRAQAAWSQIQPGQPFVLEGIQRRKDGTTFPVEVQFGCFDSSGQRYYIGHVRNISNRKQTEAALRESEARFSAFMDALPGFAFIKDTQGRHVFANKALLAALGVADSAWRGKTNVELARGLDLSAINADDRRLLATREAFTTEQVLNLPARTATFLTTKFPLQNGSADSLFGGIAIDITARKQAEDELRKLHDRLRTIGDNLPDGYIYQVERAVGQSARFTFISAGAQSVHGVSPETVQRDPCILAAQIHEDDLAPWAAAEEKSYRDLTKFSVDLRLRSPDGGHRWLQLNSTPHRLANGTVVWNGIALDVTARKQAEALQLVRSKLAATGVLAAGLAHDYNNILQVLLLHLEAAKTPGCSPTELRTCLDEATQAVHTARDLTKQLVTFAEGGDPLRQLVNVGPILRDAFTVALRGSNVAGHCELASDLWWAEADRGQIEHVITQLVANAREAMPRGGRVILRMENLTASDGPGASLPAGDYVHCRITDEGPGIPAEILPKIFDPYFSTKPRGVQKGMGLGLTLCRSVIERHGGTITVETTLGHGTTVHFYLPATRRAASSPTSPAATAPVTSLTGKIIVMDDDAPLRAVLRLTLQTMGYAATVAAHGEAAVAAYREAQDQGQPFDLALLDLTVRDGMGGLETLAELRRINPAVRAIVMSGYSNNSALQHWREAGFVGALAKPFEPTALAQLLAQTLTRSS